MFARQQRHMRPVMPRVLGLLPTEQFGILLHRLIVDTWQRRPRGADGIALEGRRHQGDEVDQIAPIGIAGVPVERNAVVEAKIDVAHDQFRHG